LLLVAFSLSVLAGLGWETISQMVSGRKTLWATLGFGCIGIAVLLWVWLKAKPQFQHLDEAHHAFIVQHILIFAAQLVAVIIFGVGLKWWNRRAMQVICLSWIAVDLLC